MPDVADVSFQLEYDGPALVAHEMDVRSLAPALLSAGELFQQVNRILHPEDPEVTVNVRATSEGSFLIDLKLVYEASINLFSDKDVVAGSVLIAYLSFIGTLIALMNHRHKRGNPRTQEPADAQGMITLDFGDGVILRVPQEVLQLESDLRIRHSLREVVRPLSRDGVDAVTLRRSDTIIARIDKTDWEAFESVTDVPLRDVVSMSERMAVLRIINAAFQPDNKWRFSDGRSTFWATITAQDFLARIEAGEPFAKYDLLRCRIRETQWRDDSGLHAEIEVLDVLEHQGGQAPAESQKRLFNPSGTEG